MLERRRNAMPTSHPFQTLMFCMALAACHRQSPADEPVAPRRGPSPEPPPPAAADLEQAGRVVAFWRDAGPRQWFAKDPAFDAAFRDLFLSLHERAARGELASWRRSPEGALALLILLDQFPRNAFRGAARMYATDEMARREADLAIEAGHDRAIDEALRIFVYLPFGHSESLADQERSVSLARARLRPVDVEHAEHHRDIIKRFGRFPHRNPILGRAMRPEEQAYLDQGGFKG